MTAGLFPTTATPDFNWRQARWRRSGEALATFGKVTMVARRRGPAFGRISGKGEGRMKAFSRSAVAAAVTAASPPAVAWAQTTPEPYGYGPQMMWGWGWYGMILGPFFMILMLAVVITAVVLAVRWLGGPWQAPPRHSSFGRTAIDILDERLARGEIDQAEYEAKRRLISQG